jgi:hypothetical protein
MSVDGTRPSGSLEFQIYLSGPDLELDQSLATLEAGAETLSGRAEVRDADYAGGSEAAPAGAALLTPGARVPLYSVPRKALLFRFDKPCDPIARYRLTVFGIVSRGRQVALPPIDFEPESGWVPRFLD